MGLPGELAVGDHFQHYEVLGKLGEGGFATVYRVRAGAEGPDLALKLSHGAVGLGDAAKRALREVEVLRSLTNRHVVRIHGAGIAPDGRVYIAMERLVGGAMSQGTTSDEPMPAARALGLMHQACMGLAEAHALGIVHRDLKPENLWVEPDGNLKVIDFGLARAWDTGGAIGANVTMGQVLVGTPHYMQPEQMLDNRMSPASDVYSVATLLYELLIGYSVYFDDGPLSQVRARLRDDPVFWIDAHANRRPIPLSRHAHTRELPSSIDALLMRCLRKDPDERPADAVQVAMELGEILHYEYGQLPGSIVRIGLPYGAEEEQLLLPGSHRIGSDPSCQIRMSGEDVEPFHALLEWDGPPDVPRVRPLGDHGPVVIDGVLVKQVAQLDAASKVEIGGFSLAFCPN